MSLIPGETAALAPGRWFSVRSGRYSRVLGLLAKRLIQIPIVLFAVSILTFWLIELVPGDPGRNALGQYATQAQVRAWDVGNGLTGPVTGRYLHWLGGFLPGDWGTSFTYQVPARPLIFGHLVNTMLLGCRSRSAGPRCWAWSANPAAARRPSASASPV
jgi:peptide/nickel transport system permease protein